MLEIHFLQQDNETLNNPPAKFHITQLKNGSYALSSIEDHYRLNHVLSNWQNIHSLVQNPDEKYQAFLDISKNSPNVNSKKKCLWSDCPSENVSSFEVDSFASEIEKDFSLISLLDVTGSQRTVLQEECLKDKFMKHPEGKRVFIGCKDGYLYEYLMNEKKIAYNFGKILDAGIHSMAATFDNKYLLVCSESGLREVDISTRNQVNNFGVKNARKCVVTYDNKFLITSSNGSYVKLTKQSIQTKHELVWYSSVNESVCC